MEAKTPSKSAGQAQDELQRLLEHYEQQLQAAVSRENAIVSERGRFIQKFLALCHGEWMQELEAMSQRLSDAGHGAEINLSQEPWQEMLMLHVRPKVSKELRQANHRDFDYRIKIYPNEVQMRACFTCMTPDQFGHAANVESYKLEELTAEGFRIVVLRQLAKILDAALPH